MKLLVLGNGFDLDHELPTSYLAFLNFCNYALTLENPETPVNDKLTEVQLMYSDILKKNEPIKSTFLSFISQNRLLDYFNKRTEELGENWIDFEHEIDGIIREFKAIETELKSSNSHSYIPNRDHKIHKVMHDLGLGDLDHGPWNEILLATIHSDLCTALNMFSNALEYYISVFINTTPLLGFSPDILNFEANKILTFNYSDTYERWYSGIQWNESIDHVHGMAVGNLRQGSNIILGVTSDSSNPSSYVEFEKYFQRITKKTGNEYKTWLQLKEPTKEKIEVMFFGHSLDTSDSDIIKDLVLNKYSVVSIYYYSEQHYQNIVANLVDIIGKDTLIQFVSGKNPKLSFIKQSTVYKGLHRVGI